MKKTFKPMLIASAIFAIMAADVANAWTTVPPTALANNTPVPLSVRKLSFSDPAFGYQAWAMHGKWVTFTAVVGQPITLTVDGSAATAGFHPAVTIWKRPIGTPAQPYTYKVGKVVNNVTNLTPARYVPDHNFDGTKSYINSAATQQHNQEASSGSCTNSDTLTCALQTRTITDSTGTPVTITAKSTEFWNAAKRTSPTTGDMGVLLEDGTTDIGLPRMIRATSVADGDGAPRIFNRLNVDPNLRVIRDGVAGKVTAIFTPKESAQYQAFIGGWNAGASADLNNNVIVTIDGAAN